MARYHAQVTSPTRLGDDAQRTGVGRILLDRSLGAHSGLAVVTIDEVLARKSWPHGP